MSECVDDPAREALQNRVYVIDDEPAVVRALARLLRKGGFAVRGFSSPQAFLREYRPEAAGCVIVDLAMPGLSGLELQRAIAVGSCPPPCIFLSGRGDVRAAAQAMKAGAMDFLTKPVDSAALLAAVGAAMERDAKARALRMETAALRARYAQLTPRERQVFTGVVAGHLNKQIALQLGTVEKTVKVHRARMMQKMAAANVAELVRMSGRLLH